jgi:hypothetical protein
VPTEAAPAPLPEVAAEAAAAAPVAEAPATEAAAEDDPDDPMKLIRPATGTAKREHG